MAFYPEQIRDQVGSFITAFEAVRQTGSVPEIVRHCEFAIGQRDAGDETLSSILREDPVRGRRLYLEAIETLVEFQKAAGDASDLNPPFNQEKFLSELRLTDEYYFQKLLGGSDDQLHRELRRWFESLAERLVAHPYVLCHRDYHGENIHAHDGRIYIIDYQDLRMGPDTYDLASLLRDRGMVEILGREFEQEALAKYGELTSLDSGGRGRYYEALLQRTIKTLGTFAMQAVTRDRKHYLDYVGPALRTIRECADELPEYEDLARLFPKADE